MEQLQKDLQGMQLSEGRQKKYQSFLDIVGADVDSSYDRPMTCQFVQDTYHISQGGQVVGENANIQIQIDDDNSLHYLWRYGIMADFQAIAPTAADNVVPCGYLENAAMLFDGLEMQLGNVSWSCAFQKYYAQQKLAKLGKKKLEYIGNGLLLKHDGFAQTPNPLLSQFVAGSYLEVNAAGNGFTQNGQALVANTIVSEAVEEYQLYARQLKMHCRMRREYTDGGNVKYKIFVPLPCIFPALWEIPDDGCVFTGLGQKIKFNIKTTPAIECIMSDQVGAISYRLQNMTLARFYTKLDPIRTDLILKSSLQLPHLKYIQWSNATVANPINAIFGISNQDRVKGLIFGFHTKITSDPNATDGSNVAANLLNNTAAQFKYPLGYFPQVPIQDIQVIVGGNTYAINMIQLQAFHLSGCISDQEETYDFPLQRQNKMAYYLDLTRFGANEDLFGSSSKSITSVQIQITLKTGAGSRTLYNQAADWNTDATAFNNFAFYGFLEVQSMFECKNGTYVP